ncbi:MAG: IS630 family transposase [bacterium]
MTKSENKNNTIYKLRKMLKEFDKEKDTRSILRIKALIAYYNGMSSFVIAKCYEITEKTLKNWIKRFENEEPLNDLSRSGRPNKLSKEQQEALCKMLTDQNQRVWVARHICVWLMITFNVCYSVRYLPEFLRKMGLSFHKAVHMLIKKNNDKRKTWIQETILAIYADKIKQGWRLFFQDEVGFQTEGTLAYSWGQRGKKNEIDNYGRHGRLNLIGAFELGTGVFYGVMTKFRVNASRFRRFLCHLKHEMRTDKIMIICDNARFHKAKWLTEWVSKQNNWLRLEFLPPYSPDFNPIERLWRWIKTEHMHNRCWKTLDELKEHLIQVVKDVKQRSSELTSVMRQEIERLNKIFEFYERQSPFSLLA